MSAKASLFWFRRDLRLEDNPALAAAAAEGPVLGLFVLDQALMRPAGPPRRHFLTGSLASLDESLRGRLSVLEGPPAEVVVKAAAEVGACDVYATTDFGPYGRARDRDVIEALQAAGARLHLLDSPYAVVPGTLRTSSGTPFQVFTPFYKAWLAHDWDGPVPAPDVDWLTPLSGARLVEPTLDEAVADRAWPVGERAAQQRLAEFLDGPVQRYKEDRDQPGQPATSRLSPHLKWGLLHPRQILDALAHVPGPGSEAFARQLAWREFYADVLHHQPRSAREAYQRPMAAMELDEGPEADRRFEAWAQGLTGYPIVDAGMRQLAATGWMHNRVRLIVASFLVKDLHLDWTRGARWFMRRLVDGDLANNSHGWQWVAGTGTDAAPYFRIFNPVSQGQKFDPDGTYVRAWVPEVAHLADRWVHQPWADPHGAPAGYPDPIVDHDRERKESLRRYERLTERGRGRDRLD